jgi:hypothetical protein
MLLEDRVITSDLLLQQAALDVLDADLLVPSGIPDLLETPAFHMVVPCGRVQGVDTDKMLVRLLLDTQEGVREVDVMVEDDWFARLPTAFQVLDTVRRLLPSAAELTIDELSAETSDGRETCD